MRWLLTLLLLLLAPSAPAQTAGDYQARADQLIGQLKGPGEEEAFFSPLFLSAVPIAQWHALAEQLRTRNGAVEGIARIIPESRHSGVVEVRYARAVVAFNLVIAPEKPHLVIGLRMTGARVSNDSLAQVRADIAALPGQTALLAAALGEGAPRAVLELHPDRQMATGSVYKMYLLAELSRAIAADERNWSDVVPLGPKSFSGRLTAFPDAAPMTLHSLALAMIAESDNSAADTLLRLLGREKVDALVRKSGHGAPDRTLPLLTTTEAFALKMPGAAALRERFISASPAERARLLHDNAGTLNRDAVDISRVADRPVEIERIEWFAAPADTVHLLDMLRRQGGEALPILSVNPGIAPGDAARWAYLGYKGGSEPGVMAISFLARSRDGRWYAMAGSWNNAHARVDEPLFIALMTRALNLIAEAPP